MVSAHCCIVNFSISESLNASYSSSPSIISSKWVLWIPAGLKISTSGFPWIRLWHLLPINNHKQIKQQKGLFPSCCNIFMRFCNRIPSISHSFSHSFSASFSLSASKKNIFSSSVCRIWTWSHLSSRHRTSSLRSSSVSVWHNIFGK